MRKKVFVIGREPLRTNGIPIRVIDPHNRVSGTHCQIIFENGFFYIEDLNSKNGTYVNGKRIHIRTRVDLNDQIIIGGSYVFSLDNPIIEKEIFNSSNNYQPESYLDEPLENYNEEKEDLKIFIFGAISSFSVLLFSLLFSLFKGVELSIFLEVSFIFTYIILGFVFKKVDNNLSIIAFIIAGILIAILLTVLILYFSFNKGYFVSFSDYELLSWFLGIVYLLMIILNIILGIKIFSYKKTNYKTLHIFAGFNIALYSVFVVLLLLILLFFIDKKYINSSEKELLMNLSNIGKVFFVISFIVLFIYYIQQIVLLSNNETEY